MRKLKYLLLIVIMYGCTEELSIAEFSDDFSSYKSELRIEAILHPVDFKNSIVRVDKTLLVTDTSLFNDIDDNGDWVGFTDENGNGKWDEGEPLNDDIGGNDGGKGNGVPDPGEPHIDDLTEILPFVHDSTMSSVVLVEKSTGILKAEFEWKGDAGIIEEYIYDNESGEERIDIYSYGGYIPTNEYSEAVINLNTEYEFQIITSDGEFISGTTTPFEPAELILDDTEWDADTLVLKEDNDLVQFLTDEDVSFSNFTFREVITNDSIMYSYSAFFPPGESDTQGKSLYQLSRGFFPFGISELTISVFSKEYSQYFISQLPLNDKELSNLRNQNGDAVLGIAGSATVTKIHVKNIF